MVPYPGTNLQCVNYFPPGQPGEVFQKCKLHLLKSYVNPLAIPSWATLLANECSFPGYAPTGIIDGTLTDLGVDGEAIVYPSQTFTCTGPQSPAQPCFGFFIEDGYAGSFCAGVNLFDEPFYFAANLDAISVQAVRKWRNEVSVPIVTFSR